MPVVDAPRAAATVILARDRVPGGFEVLMLMRNLNSDFVGGAYVFPGGAVDEADAGDVAQAHCTGLDDEQASSILSVDHGGLAYWVACLRELFEEAGLLLCVRRDGSRLEMADDATTARFAEHRREVNAKRRGFLEVVADEDLLLDCAALSYFAHWITPVGPPRRYDTRFFVAHAPSDQVPIHDDHELVANEWVTPAEALARHGRGEMQLILPTIKNLEAVARFDSTETLLDAARRATSVPMIQPRIVPDGPGVRILLPGDDGYDDEGPAVSSGDASNAAITAASRPPARPAAPSALADHACGPACVPGELVELRDSVVRVTAPNPSIMTGPGTNTYIVGDDEVVVIDPGPVIDAHLASIAAAIDGRRVRAVAVTHHHIDHAPAARVLADEHAAPVVGFGHAELDVDVRSDEGTGLHAGSVALVAWHTPGHTSDHLCFYAPSMRWLFSGDHLMEGSTVVISPPEGDLTAYLASLARVRDATGVDVLAPGHGRLLGTPSVVAADVYAHRMARAEVVASTLAEHGPATAAALRAFAYADVGPERDAVATATCWAHLLALVDEGKATSSGPRADPAAVFASR